MMELHWNQKIFEPTATPSWWNWVLIFSSPSKSDNLQQHFDNFVYLARDWVIQLTIINVVMKPGPNQQMTLPSGFTPMVSSRENNEPCSTLELRGEGLNPQLKLPFRRMAYYCKTVSPTCSKSLFHAPCLILLCSHLGLELFQIKAKRRSTHRKTTFYAIIL